MKCLLILTLILISCQKNTIVYQEWQRSEWCDTVAVLGDPIYCDSLRNVKKIDTVPETYNAGDPNGIYPLKTTPPIIEWRPLGDSVIRNYYRYLKQIH